MTLKRAAAGAILGATLPVYVDCATEPWSGRGLARSWLAGSCKIAVLAAIVWAAGEVWPGPGPAPVLELAAGDRTGPPG